MIQKCKFNLAWRGPCNKIIADSSGFCSEHKLKCLVCGEQATHECAETFQFVCGFPLCDKEECRKKHHPELYKNELQLPKEVTLENLSSREKQLIWRALCDSEKFENERIAYLAGGGGNFNGIAQRKMINSSAKRLKEIKALKEKWWHEM